MEYPAEKRSDVSLRFHREQMQKSVNVPLLKKSTKASLTLVTVIVCRHRLSGLDLSLHRLHEETWIVSFDDVLFGCSYHLT